MSTQILTNAFFSVGGTDLSDGLQQIDLSYEAETQDDTAMGMGVRSNKGGLKNWSITATFILEEGAGENVATLFPLVGSNTPVVLRPVNTATSATNPAYSGTGLLQSFPPFGQSVGDLRVGAAAFVPAEGSDLARSET